MDREAADASGTNQLTHPVPTVAGAVLGPTYLSLRRCGDRFAGGQRGVVVGAEVFGNRNRVRDERRGAHVLFDVVDSVGEGVGAGKEARAGGLADGGLAVSVGEEGAAGGEAVNVWSDGLAHVAVQRGARNALFGESLGETVRAALSAREDDGLGEDVVVEMMPEETVFVGRVVRLVRVLRDIVVAARVDGELDESRVAHDFFGHRKGPGLRGSPRREVFGGSWEWPPVILRTSRTNPMSSMRSASSRMRTSRREKSMRPSSM